MPAGGVPVGGVPDGGVKFESAELLPAFCGRAGGVAPAVVPFDGADIIA
jgi:hypothetical protein